LVPPLYQSSVYALTDLDALDRIMSGQEQGFIYARDGHPNARQLGEELAVLERAAWGVVAGSGMGAISALSLALLHPGERVVASHRLYGRTTQLLTQELARFGIEVKLADVSDLAQVETALKPRARLLFVETLSNPLLRVADIARLSQVAHDHDCQLAVDNTFATPVLTRPLELGADLVMESLTKMLGGHSDVTLGALCGRNVELLPQINQVISIWGLASNPFDAWLASRGLATLPLRMRTASANAAALAEWLADQPGVSHVVYPGRSDHPDHHFATQVLDGGLGNMLCFELTDGREAVNRFLRRAACIPFSPSLGHTSTTCSHPATTSHRYVSPAERKRQGISEGLVRLSVGIEEVDLIKKELLQGLT
jgi:cystathionine beta-lyase/cystathionine gamma-synthase